MSLFKKIFSKEKKETLDKGLEKTKTNFFDKLSKAVVGKSIVDEAVLDNLEEILVATKISSKLSRTASSTIDFPTTALDNLSKKLVFVFSNPLSKVSFFSFEKIFLNKLIFIFYTIQKVRSKTYYLLGWVKF